jgi:protein TonB
VRPAVVPTFLAPPPRRRFGGVALSLLLHGALLYVILSPAFRRYHVFSPNGTGGEAAGGGGGGSGAEYIALPALRAYAEERPVTPVEVPPPVTTPPPPVPVEVPKEIPPPEPAPDSTPPPAAPAAQAPAAGTGPGEGPGQGGGTGGGTGGGVGTGTGSGVGPGTGSGLAGWPPEIKQLLIPPFERPPKELRGKTVVVTFYVNARGTVDRIETTPPIGDGRYRSLFQDAMLGFRFKPARDSTGRPANGVLPASILLPN